MGPSGWSSVALAWLAARGGLGSGGVGGTSRQGGEWRERADDVGGTGFACWQAAVDVGAGSAQAGRGRPSGFDREHEFFGGRCIASGSSYGALVAGKLFQIYAGTLWSRCSGAIRDRRDSCFGDGPQSGVARAGSRGPQEAGGVQEPAETAAEYGSHSTSIRSVGPPLRAASARTASTHRATPAGTGAHEADAQTDAPSDSRSGPAGSRPLHPIAHGAKVLPRHHQNDCLSRGNQHGSDRPRKAATQRRRACFAPPYLQHRG